MKIRTIEEVSNALSSKHPDPRTFTFLKEDDRWFIDLPEYVNHGGRKEDLQMKAGADDLLNLVAQGKRMVIITMDIQPFEGAEVLNLVKLCDQPQGGGYYMMHRCMGRKVNERMWLCDVTLFVFGDIPERIYIRKETGHC